MDAKILSKNLAERLEDCLPEVVAEDQTGFGKGNRSPPSCKNRDDRLINQLLSALEHPLRLSLLTLGVNWSEIQSCSIYFCSSFSCLFLLVDYHGVLTYQKHKPVILQKHKEKHLFRETKLAVSWDDDFCTIDGILKYLLKEILSESVLKKYVALKRHEKFLKMTERQISFGKVTQQRALMPSQRRYKDRSNTRRTEETSMNPVPFSTDPESALPSYEQALVATGQYDAPPPPYPGSSSGSLKSHRSR
ncbi:uncharacterized protein LOC119970942 [Scyliorhinus canicula]|uniref:uncharacterized protein LOC119970942 n=1 Tax=Scyliorhinus canicula TaxID=7830 RepID=UPI0018F64746|nr:uncharacterized protein LOC119970942 [Scyliorhinus canicula]